MVKGKAGSPYAIKDYYDIDPDLAEKVPNRMKEFEALVKRTHDAGMKVIIDFVPNHVAREYYSDARMSYVEDLGQHDDTTKGFDRNNNFYYIPDACCTCRLPKRTGITIIVSSPQSDGNDCFSPCPGKNDWYETVKLNYGVDYVNGRIGHFNLVPGNLDEDAGYPALLGG